MAAKLSNLIRGTIEAELPNLRALTEECASIPRGAGKWCPKEELGHLIDSAANNHQRFVRAALDGEFRGPSYAQDEWVRLHGYREMPWDAIVTFWHRYNLLLAEVAARIPEERLPAPCFIGGAPPVTLQFVIEDYVLHMRHHLDQLLRRATVTAYPGAAMGV